MIGAFVQFGCGRRAAPEYVGYVICENGCWQWTGATSKGYGNTWIGGRNAAAHRVVYEAHRGAIPPGKVLDHLCRNKLCVRPDHLEAVSNGENVLRGDGVTAKNARAVRCPAGHLIQSVGSRRLCVECHRLRGVRDNPKRRQRRHARRSLPSAATAALLATGEGE